MYSYYQTERLAQIVSNIVKNDFIFKSSKDFPGSSHEHFAKVQTKLMHEFFTKHMVVGGATKLHDDWKSLHIQIIYK